MCPNVTFWMVLVLFSCCLCLKRGVWSFAIVQTEAALYQNKNYLQTTVDFCIPRPSEAEGTRRLWPRTDVVAALACLLLPPGGERVPCCQEQTLTATDPSAFTCIHQLQEAAVWAGSRLLLSHLVAVIQLHYSHLRCAGLIHPFTSLPTRTVSIFLKEPSLGLV